MADNRDSVKKYKVMNSLSYYPRLRSVMSHHEPAITKNPLASSHAQVERFRNIKNHSYKVGLNAHLLSASCSAAVVHEY